MGQKIEISSKCNLFTAEIIKSLLRANNDKRIISIHSIERYAYGMNQDLICKNEKNEV